MNTFEIAPLEKDICKNHTVRSNKQVCRINASKLSKQELEDLYYKVFQENLDLKRLVNVQKDKLNLLNTKILRLMATQRIQVSKDCCVGPKAIINEQKEMIQNLKQSNEKLVEKVRQLKMRLCSNKQFMKTSPGLWTRVRSSANITKNSTLSTRNSSETIQSPMTCHQSIQKKDESTNKPAENISNTEEKENSNNLCCEDKCKTQMDELKHKIVNLQEELGTIQENYTKRIASLEDHVARLSKEMEATQAARAASQLTIMQRQADVDKLASILRSVEMHTNEISTQLCLERMKVSELEMQLKASKVSNQVFNVIEEYFHNNNSKTKNSAVESNVLESATQEISANRVELVLGNPPAAPLYVGDHKFSTPVPTPRRKAIIDEGLSTMNEELCKKVIQLQAELDKYQVSAAVQNTTKVATASNQAFLQSMVNDVDDQNCVIVESSKHFKNEADRDNKSEESNTTTLVQKKSIEVSYRIEVNEVKSECISDTILQEKQNPHSHSNELKGKVFQKSIENIRDDRTPPIGRDRKKDENPSTSLPKTYIVKAEVVENDRSVSPDNTDYNVSSITDAPSIRSRRNSSVDHSKMQLTSRSPTEPLSLGEDRDISTATDISTSTERNFLIDKSLGYLSDGEIPSVNRRLSEKWKESKEIYFNENLVPRIQESKAEKMKAAIQQVTEHLARCRQLQDATKLTLCSVNTK